jgi:hypothetical protein
MKLLHLLGHNHKWALDAYFQNNIGGGFIFGAFNFQYLAFNGKISGYSQDEYLGVSLFDPQFYANKVAEGGKLGSYPFHPLHSDASDITEFDTLELVYDAVQFQENKNFFAIIVPNFYADNFQKSLKYIDRINERMKNTMTDEREYYLTIPIAYDHILNEQNIERLLFELTDKKINFDGFYLALEAKPEFKNKLCLNADFLLNVLNILRTLKHHGFKIILSYANFDALVYFSLCDIDYISIGTYENLRKFSNDRFIGSIGGGPSDGWYFSEKLLNFVKAPYIAYLRRARCLDLITNESNIFSDAILQPHFAWNTHKPDVHKNYLLSISRLFDELAAIKDIGQRADTLISKIDSARELYSVIWNDYNVKLLEESSDKHLADWLTFISLNKS